MQPMIWLCSWAGGFFGKRFPANLAGLTLKAGDDIAVLVRPRHSVMAVPPVPGHLFGDGGQAVAAPLSAGNMVVLASSAHQVIKAAVAAQVRIAPLQDMRLVRYQRDSEVARFPGDFRAGDAVQTL